ncbi:MAG: mechanosensitive ion channel domain-containing protein [Bacteroidota bacterium]
MSEIINQIAAFLEDSPDIAYQLLETVLSLLVIWGLRLVVLRIINRRIENRKLRYKWKKNLTYISTSLSILVIFGIWFSGLGEIATYLGLLSAGIAIALKDPVSDMAGWLFIIWRRPFDLGDRIELGQNKGDVIDVRVFKFTLLEIGNWVDADQSTGRVIHIPNHRVFTDSIANYTSDFEFIWNEIAVLITFESDWEKARDILKDIVEEETRGFIQNAREQITRAERSYLIQYKHLTPIVYVDVKDSGVNLTIRYLTNPRTRRGTAQQIWVHILKVFKELDDVDLAYPTYRLYDNVAEGKPGTKPGSTA